MPASDYLKYTISFSSEDLSKCCKMILDNKAILLGDSMFVFTLNNEVLSYIKENFKSVNGVHVSPFMLEAGLEDFESSLDGLVNWMIYSDSTKKYVDNFMVIAPTESLYNQAYPICDKQVYITKYDKRWPIADDCCMQGNLDIFNGSYSVDNHHYYWMTTATGKHREITPSTVVPPGYNPLRPDIIPPVYFMYNGDLYIQHVPGKGEESSSGGSSSGTTKYSWDKHVDVHTLTFNMKKMFSTRVGAVSSGAELGTDTIVVEYRTVPDPNEPYSVSQNES